MCSRLSSAATGNESGVNTGSYHVFVKSYVGSPEMFSFFAFSVTVCKLLIYFSAGYNYYGTERMYSGVDGREFEADIFFGVVYYQRLRHMVADKYQVINPTHPSPTYCLLSHFESRRFQPVNDDIILCVSSDWL